MMFLVGLCTVKLALADQPVKPISKGEIVRIIKSREDKLINLECTVEESIINSNEQHKVRSQMSSRSTSRSIDTENQIPIPRVEKFKLQSTRHIARRIFRLLDNKTEINRLFDGKYDYFFSKNLSSEPHVNYSGTIGIEVNNWKPMLMTGYWTPARSPLIQYRSWSEMLDQSKLKAVSYRSDPKFGKVLVAHIRRRDRNSGTLEFAMDHGFLPVHMHLECPLTFVERQGSPVHHQIWTLLYDAEKLTMANGLPFVVASRDEFRVTDDKSPTFDDTSTYTIQDITPNQPNFRVDLTLPEGMEFVKSLPSEPQDYYMVRNGELVEYRDPKFLREHVSKPLFLICLLLFILALTRLVIMVRRSLNAN